MLSQKKLINPTQKQSSYLSVSTLTSLKDSKSSAQMDNSDEEELVASNFQKFSQDKTLRKLLTTEKKPMEQFIWTTSPQPHAIRRRKILEKYPEIEKLYGSDRSQAITTVITIILQLYMAYYMSKVNLSILTYVSIVFLISGTLNHSLFAAMHECSHRTMFQSKFASELFCIITTIPMGLPAAIPFKRYHLDHHIYQGVTNMDPDLPTEIEAWFFHNSFRKFIWVALMPLTYSLRPLITRPKKVVSMDIFSWFLVFTVDFSVLYFWGMKSILYFLLGTMFSMNFHPFAGHFISEHFILPETDMYQETSSYYGFSNILTYNVGYHNEHHDFPRVPGSRLPLVRKIAAEFYNFPDHKSWMNVTWKFILTPVVTPFNRVKRVGIKGGELPSTLLKFKYHDKMIPYGGSDYFWPKLDT